MRFYFLPIIVVLLCTAPLSLYAQTNATTTATSSDSSNFFEAIINTVAGTAETIAPNPTRTSVLSLAVEKRLTNLAANISNRLDGLNARLRQIAGRLEQRIATQAENGYAVDAARGSLQSAYTALDNASRELETIDNEVYRAFRSQNPRAEWQKVRSKYLAARDNIRTAHTELKNTVVHLKSATPAAVTATSTASSTQ